MYMQIHIFINSDSPDISDSQIHPRVSKTSVNWENLGTVFFCIYLTSSFQIEFLNLFNFYREKGNTFGIWEN